MVFGNLFDVILELL